MDVVIKLLGKKDAALLERVAEDVFDDALDPALLARYLAARNHLLCVAMVEGEVVGQARAVIHRHPDRADELYLDNLGVAPAYQRQGIATRLVRELRRQGKKRGCKDLWVATESENAPALAFYRALGLKRQQMDYFEDEL